MFHVIQTGGKQYIVQKGDKIVVEKLDAEVGGKVTLPVLLSFDDEGKLDFASDATVEVSINLQDRGDKIRVFKMKRRKRYRRSQGHRQYQTTLEITKAS